MRFCAGKGSRQKIAGRRRAAAAALLRAQKVQNKVICVKGEWKKETDYLNYHSEAALSSTCA